MARLVLVLLLLGLFLYPTPSLAEIPQTNSKEEAAVYKMCNANSPDGVCPEAETSNLDSFLNAIKDWFYQNPENPTQMTAQADLLDQIQKPEEVEIKEESTIWTWLGNLIGSSDSSYVKDAPEFEEDQYSTEKNEGIFEDAIAPENIGPITGQEQ